MGKVLVGYEIVSTAAVFDARFIAVSITVQNQIIISSYSVFLVEEQTLTMVE